MEKLTKILAFRLAKLSLRISDFFSNLISVIKLMYKTFKDYKFKKGSIFSDNFKIDYYLYQAILSDILKILMALVLNLILGTLVEFLIIILVFGSLRFLTGGFHASSFNSCVVITLSLFTITPIIAKLLTNNININIFYLTEVMIFCLLLDILYSPKFLIELDRKIKFKNKILSVIYIILAYITVLKFRGYSIIIFMGILVQLITVTPVMYAISNKLKNRGDATL